MKPSRREIVVAGAAVGLATACGRSALYEEDDHGVAASAPEEDDVPIEEQKVPEPTLPVHLTAAATLASNTTGGVNTVALKNPLGVAMEIHQIKWMISGASGSNNQDNIFGGIIACKLDLGTNPVTNGFVPTWLFGRPEDLSSETRVGVTGQATSFFSWRLPRPLYIPAGAVLTPTFQHRGLLSTPLTTRISYVGKSLINKRLQPRKLYIPYVASYISPNFDFTPSTSVAASSESTETDLVNPHKEPLFLQRFTGRLQTYINSINGLVNMTETAAQFADTRTTMRMVDSNGRPVVQSFTQFRQAFAGATRSWDLDNGAVMDPNSYYKAFLKTNPVGLTWFSSANITAVLQQAHIGLVGWREIGEG